MSKTAVGLLLGMHCLAPGAVALKSEISKSFQDPSGLETHVWEKKKEPVEANAQSWAISCVCVNISIYTHTCCRAHVMLHLPGHRPELVSRGYSASLAIAFHSCDFSPQTTI